jgi:hypothetical protein
MKIVKHSATAAPTLRPTNITSSPSLIDFLTLFKNKEHLNLDLEVVNNDLPSKLAGN